MLPVPVKNNIGVRYLSNNRCVIENTLSIVVKGTTGGDGIVVTSVIFDRNINKIILNFIRRKVVRTIYTNQIQIFMQLLTSVQEFRTDLVN